MELIHLISAHDPALGIQERPAEALSGIPELRQLEILTDFLTGAAVIDDKFEKLVYAAWEYICRSNIWCCRYNSSQQYCELVSYRDIIQPIIDRLTKSDLSKLSSIETIQQQWELPVISPGSSAGSSNSSSSSRETATQEAHSPPADHHPDSSISSPSTDALEPLIAAAQKPCNYPSDSISFPRKAGGRYGCECSPICLPLTALLSGRMFHPTHEVTLQLFQWAKSVLWSSICLVHLQRLAALRFGHTTTSWSRQEAIKQMDCLLLESMLSEVDSSVTELDDLLVA